MRRNTKNFGLESIRGAPGLAAAAFRLAAAAVEPAYRAAVAARNAAFDRGWKRAVDLGRPTVGVGNLTTGGTGKTPVVLWVARRLRAAGYRPAVLLRGYGSTPSADSDERMLLERSLNDDPARPKVPVVADPSRVAGAAAAVRADPSIDWFILDDGFQHRRAARDFDLVLINAVDPFGGGRLLPRGLLREPVAGIARAHAVLITRAALAVPEALADIERSVRRVAASVPIYRCDHHLSLDPAVVGQKVVAVCGIGDPDSFVRQLSDAGAPVVDRIVFDDHHGYVPGDIVEIRRRCAGRLRVTTAKDWVKIEPLLGPADRADWSVAGVEVQFAGDDADDLFAQILGAKKRPHGGGLIPCGLAEEETS